MVARRLIKGLIVTIPILVLLLLLPVALPAPPYAQKAADSLAKDYCKQHGVNRGGYYGDNIGNRIDAWEFCYYPTTVHSEDNPQALYVTVPWIGTPTLEPDNFF